MRGDFDALRELAIYYDTLITRYVYPLRDGRSTSRGAASAAARILYPADRRETTRCETKSAA